MLKGLSSKLRESLEKLARSGADRDAVEELVKDIQRALLSADVDVDLVFELSESIRKRAFASIPAGVTRREYVVRVVYEELTRVMGETRSEVAIKPKKVLLVGLYGSGKTTTAAKLGHFYKGKGLRVALVCCDTVRPAAYEQLQQLAERIDAQFYGEKQEKDASRIVRNAMKQLNADVIIADSSGRNALSEDLVEEIKKVNSAFQPDERILVLPADIGQAAREQADAFHEALGITDVIVTKLDATAKGGGALTACSATDAKIIFITTGETPDALEAYDPQKFVARLIGMPDLETLLEKARKAIDEKKAEKIIKGDFDLEDFYSQIEGMQKIGPMSQIVEMAGMGKFAKRADFEKEQAKMKKWKFIIQSMTPEEKAAPDTINSSRIRRIAAGSGTAEAEVRELLSNFSKAKKVMKRISPARLKRGGIGSLFKQFGM